MSDLPPLLRLAADAPLARLLKLAHGQPVVFRKRLAKARAELLREEMLDSDWSLADARKNSEGCYAVACAEMAKRGRG